MKRSNPTSDSSSTAADHEPAGRRQDAFERPAAAAQAEPGGSRETSASRSIEGQEEASVREAASVGLELDSAGVESGLVLVLVLLPGVALPRDRGGVAGEGLAGVAQAGRGPRPGPGPRPGVGVGVPGSQSQSGPGGGRVVFVVDAADAQLPAAAEGQRGGELGAQVCVRHGAAEEDWRSDRCRD